MFKASTRGLGAAAAVAALILLAGCGAGGSGAPSGSGSSGDAAGGAVDIPAVAKDEALAKLVPSEIAADGKIAVGTNAYYPPNEFFDTDNRTVIGMDADLARAVGQKLGVPVEFQNTTFDGIIPGLTAGKFEFGISSFFINPDRVATVDMVSYLNVGTRMGGLKGNPEGLTVDTLCGKAVGVQKGTAQVDELDARSKKCTTEGKPAINITQLQEQTEVNVALTSKRVSAMLADSPVIYYATKVTNGAVEPIGPTYDNTQYGIVLAKNKGQFGEAIQGALRALVADGTYAKILAKWNQAEGAIPAPELKR